jgi:hypothetical protein
MEESTPGAFVRLLPQDHTILIPVLATKSTA